MWAAVFGLSAYALGRQIEELRGTAAILLTTLGLAAAIAGFIFVRRHETALEDRAEQALPGPIR